MFVNEGGDCTYAHCYEDDDAGHEYGCGMEYEYHPETGLLDYWHDAVGLVTTRRMTSGEWDGLVSWHERNCTRVRE